MPRGQPDYGIMTQTPVASGISDPGEAAARLGSINVYDRRGWVVWMDDFEAPNFKWGPAAFGVGVVPVLVTTTSWIGIQSVYFSAPAGVISESRIYRRFPLLRSGRAGVEFWVCGTTQNPGYIYLSLSFADGVNIVTASWRLDTVNRNLYIISGGIVTLIASDVYSLPADRFFLPVKLVVDMDTDYYTRLLAGPDEYDLSSYPLNVVGPTVLKYIDVFLGVRGAGAPIDCSGYADNFILTQNEP